MAGRPRAACGTDAAYRRHLREGERACDACREAHRVATARYRVDPASGKDRGDPNPVAAPKPPPQLAEPGDVSRRVSDLRGQREALIVAIEDADARSLPGLSRELRAVNAELDELLGIGVEKAPAGQVERVVTFDDELAAARAARQARAAT